MGLSSPSLNNLKILTFSPRQFPLRDLHSQRCGTPYQLEQEGYLFLSEYFFNIKVHEFKLAEMFSSFRPL